MQQTANIVTFFSTQMKLFPEGVCSLFPEGPKELKEIKYKHTPEGNQEGKKEKSHDIRFIIRGLDL